MFNDPLDQTYPKLNREQQKVIRQLLVQHYRHELGKYFQNQFSSSVGPNAVMIRVTLRQEFINGDGDQSATLDQLFVWTKLDRCHSILRLAASTLSEEYHKANQLDEGARQIALDIANELMQQLRAVFPELKQKELLAEIARNTADIDGLIEPSQNERRTKRRPK